MDSSSRIGAGHAVRCLSLANALRENGCDVVFVSRDEPGNVSAQVRSHGIEVMALDAGRPIDEIDDARATVDAIGRHPAADLVVVDHYRLATGWERLVRESGSRVMVIDDLPQRSHSCDLYLDQNVHARDTVRSRLDDGCVSMLGPSYALLRRSFAALRDPAREGRREVSSIMVFFGAGDQPRAVELALSALSSIRIEHANVTVIVDRQASTQQWLRGLCDEIPGCELVPHVDDMPERLARTDLAIGAGGVSALERFCMGVPSLVLAVADNQVGPSRELAAMGCEVYLGRVEEVDGKLMESGVRLLSANVHLRNHLARQGMQLVDGRGVDRVVHVIVDRDIRLRPAAVDDSEMIRSWRNDEHVRSNSLDSGTIDPGGHQRWMAQTLTDPNRCLFVAEHHGRAVGVLRYDVAGDVATVSIYLGPGERGRGVGKAMLGAGETWLAEHRPNVSRLRADVLDSNSGSRRLFEKAGFVRQRIEYEKRIQ